MPTPAMFPEAALQQLTADHQSVQICVRELDPLTRKNYLRFMLWFNRQTGKDPDQLLAWAKSVEPYELGDLISKTGEPLTEAVRFNTILAVRSFLRHNGFNNLPKQKIGYTPQEWHRGYRKEEVRTLLGYLDTKLRKLYILLAVETGLRANTVLALQYRHVSEDLEAGIVPVAVRLEPKFYKGKKSAGFTFLGERSVALLKECITIPAPVCSLNCGFFDATDLSVNPKMASANFDPVAMNVLICSGPWQCGSTPGRGGSSTYSSTHTQSANSFTFFRFGTGITPGFPGDYFRSSGMLATYLWSGDISPGVANFSAARQCFGMVPTPLSSSPPDANSCAHWQQGIGMNGATSAPGTNGCPGSPNTSPCGIPVGSNQLSIVQLYINDNWVDPWVWTPQYFLWGSSV